MKSGFYPRLAWEGLRKNKRMSIPYLITCVVMVAMFYILVYLSGSETVKRLRGASSLTYVLQLGSFVMLVFSAIFLFYTNSFLLRRRRQEFGLYHVLGMSKKNLAVIVTWEAFLSAVIALTVGLLGGIGLSKLAEMGLVKLLGGENTFVFRVDTAHLLDTVQYFAIVFALIWLVSLIRISRSSAIELMKSTSVGEKPPKARWALGILGAGMLIAAYVMAVTVENPIDAMLLFFIAVILVIVATYLLFIVGSVTVCKLLQKKKSYYYKHSHFVSLSSMAYRMKRNGAGLASVCVIATMVLVMISSSSSLFFGSQSALESRYPREVNFEVTLSSVDDLQENHLAPIRDTIVTTSRDCGGDVTNLREFGYTEIVGLLKNGIIECDSGSVNGRITNGDLREFYFVQQDVYEALSGDSLEIPEGEAALFAYHCKFEEDSLRFRDIAEIPVSSVEKGTISFAYSDTSFVGVILVVVPDLKTATTPWLVAESDEQDEENLMSVMWNFGYDVGLDSEGQQECSWAAASAVCDLEGAFRGLREDTRGGGADDFYGSNGGLFFIGILLSIVFILAAILILYYKQLSEGYEDQPRFAIMRKVGMTDREIQKSINSQLLTVFFAPLLVAALHLAFAFPMVNKLLTLFNLFDTGLFAAVTAGSVFVFGIFYALVYRVTSRTYYHIVRSGQSHG